MATVNVIFTRPVRLGKSLFRKSKRSQAVESSLLDSVAAKKRLALGEMVIPQAPAPKAEVAVKSGK